MKWWGYFDVKNKSSASLFQYKVNPKEKNFRKHEQTKKKNDLWVKCGLWKYGSVAILLDPATKIKAAEDSNEIVD